MFSFCYLLSTSHFPVNFGNTVIPRHNRHPLGSRGGSRKTDPPSFHVFAVNRLVISLSFFFVILLQRAFIGKPFSPTFMHSMYLNDHKPILSHKSKNDGLAIGNTTWHKSYGSKFNFLSCHPKSSFKLDQCRFRIWILCTSYPGLLHLVLEHMRCLKCL